MTEKPIKATLDNTTDECKTQKPILIQLEDVPQPTEDDAGKVLGVDEEGKYALVQGGGGGSDFSSIRGKTIDITVSDNVITAVEVNGVSTDPSDFFTAPYVDILLTLSVITFDGLTVEGLSGVSVFFDNGTAYLDNYGTFVIQGLYTYRTPDGIGLGTGSLLIDEGLEVDFDEGTIFISP